MAWERGYSMHAIKLVVLPVVITSYVESKHVINTCMLLSGYLISPTLAYLSTGKLPEAFQYCQVLNMKKQFPDSIPWQSCALETAEVCSSSRVS